MPMPRATQPAALLLSTQQLDFVRVGGAFLEPQHEVDADRRIVGQVDVLVHPVADASRDAHLDGLPRRIAASRSLRLPAGADDVVAEPRMLLDVGGGDLLRLVPRDEPAPARQDAGLVDEQAAPRLAIEEP